MKKYVIADARIEKNNLAHCFCCRLSLLTGVALLASKMNNMIVEIWVMISKALQDVISLAFPQTSLMIIGLQHGVNGQFADDYIFSSVNADVKNDNASVYDDVPELEELDVKPL